MQKASINKITIINLLSTLLLNSITFISAPLFSRMLGVYNYGIISIYNVAINIITMSFGLQATGTYGIAKLEFPQEEQLAYRSSALGLSITAYGIIAFITVALGSPIANMIGIPKPLIYIMLVQGLGQICVGALCSSYMMDFRARENLIISLIASVLSVALSCMIIINMPDEVNYYGRAAGRAITYAVVGCVTAVVLFRMGKTFYSKKYWRFCLPVAVPTVFHSLSGIVLNSCDKLMLQRLSSTEAVGLYGMALNFAGVMSIIWTTFNKTWVPFYCEYMRQEDGNSIKKHSKNYVELFSVLTLGFMLLTPEVFKAYASEEFWGGLRSIPVLVLGFYFVFLYSFPVNYEFFRKRTKTIAMVTFSAAMINVVLNYFLIQRHGLVGAAVATVIAHFLQFLFHLFAASMINKEEKKHFPLASMAVWGSVCVITGIVLFVIDTDGAIIRWTVGAALGIFELWRIIKRKALF